MFFLRAAAALFALLAPIPASALPVFAHRYGLQCGACHTTVPHLNEFGEAFKKGGFRLPNPRSVFPVAVKVNLAYGSDQEETGLPKALVDEIEIVSGGPIGRNASYFVEQYIVDGGRPGRTRDAWLAFDRNVNDNVRTRVQAGQFSLAMPVDVESERDTPTHYLLFDQAVGSNAFTFFDPRLGIDASATAERAGIEAHVSALLARDPQSATSPSGIDLYGSLAKTAGRWTFHTYRYQGARNLGPDRDRFWRQGFAASYERESLSAVATAQSGHDSSADGLGASMRSSGGFIEARWAKNPGLTYVARYEGTTDPLAGPERRFVFATVLRPRVNMRFTLEDAVRAGHHTLNTAWLFAY